MSETFRNTIHGLIIDMDGVLWRGEQQIGDLKEIFSTIKKRGLKTVLATNNATRSVEQYHHKLNKFGVCYHSPKILLPHLNQRTLRTLSCLVQRFCR